MANIMITDQCNLCCPYCFANEFVNKESNEIRPENFQKALDFIVRDGSRHSIGLIGGEPTLHSQFNKLLAIALSDNRVEKVVLYTNGLLLQRYPDLITHPKMRYLINCNSPQDIGKKHFRKLTENLDWLIERKFIVYCL